MNRARPDLHLRPLDERDLGDVQGLLDADPGFARRTTGGPPLGDAAVELLTGRPPELSPGGKALLGAYDGSGALVAVADVLRGWPDRATAHIGLLQIHASHQRRGVGRRTHELLVQWLERWPEVRRTRATIVATNAAHAEPFWRALGYRPAADPVPYRVGDLGTTATAWTRRLSRPPRTAPRPGADDR